MTTEPEVRQLTDPWPPFWADRVLGTIRDLVIVDVPSSIAPDSTSSPAFSTLSARVARHLKLPATTKLDEPTRRASGVSGAWVLSASPRAMTAFERSAPALTLSVVVARGAVVPKLRSLASSPRVVRRGSSFVIVELDIPIATPIDSVLDSLASAGCPVVGDLVRGGLDAPRLFAHVSAIRSSAFGNSPAAHVIHAPLPDLFVRWCTSTLSSEERIVEALQIAFDRRYELAHAVGTDVFRLCHEAGDRTPGLAVDWYAGWVVVHVVAGAPVWMASSQAILDALASRARGVYLKVHPKQLSNIVDPRRDDLAPTTPVRGEAAPSTFVVHENGVRYRVSLGDGLATGLYLDQRDNRARVRAIARNTRVLNLFAYTCSFTSAAALGGASSSVSVDVSRGVLDRGAGNLRENGVIDHARHLFVRDDAAVYVRRALARGDRFDLIILDPPSFASTRDGTFEVDRDLGSMVRDCLSLLTPGGSLFACTNHRQTPVARLLRLVQNTADALGVALDVPRTPSLPIDFPVSQGDEPHMKCVVVRRSRSAAPRDTRAVSRPAPSAGRPSDRAVSTRGPSRSSKPKHRR